MNAHEIVIKKMQRHNVLVVLYFFAERIRQSGHTARVHSDVQIVALSIGRADIVRIGISKDLRFASAVAMKVPRAFGFRGTRLAFRIFWMALRRRQSGWGRSQRQTCKACGPRVNFLGRFLPAVQSQLAVRGSAWSPWLFRPLRRPPCPAPQRGRSCLVLLE